MDYVKEQSILNGFFDVLEVKLKFKHWYFGHFHNDQNLDDHHTVIYNNIIPIE